MIAAHAASECALATAVLDTCIATNTGAWAQPQTQTGYLLPEVLQLYYCVAGLVISRASSLALSYTALSCQLGKALAPIPLQPAHHSHWRSHGDPNWSWPVCICWSVVALHCGQESWPFPVSCIDQNLQTLV